MERAVTAQKKKRKRTGTTKYIDYTLLLMIICILGFGLVMLYSTSAYNATLKFGSSIYYLKRQAMSAGLGFVLLYICVPFFCQICGCGVSFGDGSVFGGKFCGNQ